MYKEKIQTQTLMIHGPLKTISRHHEQTPRFNCSLHLPPVAEACILLLVLHTLLMLELQSLDVRTKLSQQHRLLPTPPLPPELLLL